MKNYFIACTILVLMSCENKTKSLEDFRVKGSLTELQEKAKSTFGALPIHAENAANPASEEKIALGAILYHDTRLSLKGNNSCNSCHNLKTFGVDNEPTSKGDNGKAGNRNSPTVLNAAIHTSQFWDGRAKDVEEQAGMPILNPDEMAIHSKEFLIKKLRETNGYYEKFKSAFPNDPDPLNYENLQKAIGAFERTLLTPARFDKFILGDNKALTDIEKKGLTLFIDEGCTTCHNGPSLGGNSFQKFPTFGEVSAYLPGDHSDIGRKKITNSDADLNMYKVPGLRNIAKTYPYFHNGSIKDLKEAVSIMGLAQLNKKLDEDKIDAIVAFLESLTGEIPANALKTPTLP